MIVLVKHKLLLCGVVAVVTGMNITEASDYEFELAPIIVTANRDKVPEMDTPASVQVITKEKIEATGARNVYEALRFVPGIYFNAFGAKGVDMGDHNTTLSVRGVDQGASVLLNGIPIAANNFTQLSSIDKDTIERIEVVKGASAVLYGPETMTGVINIITKKGERNKKPVTTVEGSWGTHGNHDFHMDYSGNKINIGYSKKYIGAYAPISDSFWDWYAETDVYAHRKKSSWENIYVNLAPTENLSVMYNHSKEKSKWGKTATNPAELMTHSYDNTYDIKGNNLIMVYDKEEFKAKLFYSDRTSKLFTQFWSSPGEKSDEDYKMKRYGADVQKTWNFNEKSQLITGLTGEQEQYTELVGTHEGKRNQYAGYGQYTWKPNEKYKSILGVRFQHAKDDLKTYDEWIPQWQQMYKLSEDEMFYTNVGKSFILPRLYDYFYTEADEGLKPESGWNYELGYKLNRGKSTLRTALFYINVEDKIKVVRATPKKIIKNVGKFKNLGIEVEYTNKITDSWNWNMNFTYANPRNQEEGGQWEQTFPKLQVSAGTMYRSDLWEASLNAVYAAKRPHGIKNSLDMSMHVGYKITPRDTVSMDVYNLLNRKDVSTEWDWVAYYGDPRTVVMSYRHTF